MDLTMQSIFKYDAQGTKGCAKFQRIKRDDLFRLPSSKRI